MRPPCPFQRFRAENLKAHPLRCITLQVADPRGVLQIARHNVEVVHLNKATGYVSLREAFRLVRERVAVWEDVMTKRRILRVRGEKSDWIPKRSGQYGPFVLQMDPYFAPSGNYPSVVQHETAA